MKHSLLGHCNAEQLLPCRLFCHVICNMDVFVCWGGGALLYVTFHFHFSLHSRMTLGLSPTLYHDKNLIGKQQWMSRIAEQVVYFPLGSLWFPWARSLATFGAKETSLPVRVTGGPQAQLCSLILELFELRLKPIRLKFWWSMPVSLSKGWMCISCTHLSATLTSFKLVLEN